MHSPSNNQWKQYRHSIIEHKYKSQRCSKQQHLSLDEEFTRNQLRRCNIPPNHRPACSSVSQQRCHPRAGHDSSRIRVNCRLIHSQGDINNKPITAGFHRLSTTSQASIVQGTNHFIPAAKQFPSQPCEEAK